MTVAAFACWKDRIAPVFDTVREFHIVEIRSGKIVRETSETLADIQPFQTALRMVELHVDVVVCGAISGHIENLIAAYGLRIIPFVSGEVRQVIEAWIDGSLEKGDFAMPGCGFQRRRWRQRGAGRGMGYGRHRSNPR